MYNEQEIPGLLSCLWSLSCRGVSNMLLFLSNTFHCHYYVWGCMCSTSPFQFRWLKGYFHSSCYNHHQIGSINLTHRYHIFPWLCARDVCYIIFCHLLHTHFRILFSLSLCSWWWVQIVGYVLACRSYSFVCTLHHLIIIIVQTYLKIYKMPIGYILSSVWVRLSIFFQLSIIQDMGLCFKFTRFPCDDWENIHFVLSS